ncbi:hypothetical protein ABIB50_005145 [Mucilaginibacter sp. UYCu711]
MEQSNYTVNLDSKLRTPKVFKLGFLKLAANGDFD